MSAPADETTLPCGRSSTELITQVAERRGRGEPLTEHQRGCPHCRAALAEYARLWAPVAQIAAASVRAPRPLVDRALARVRTGAAPDGFGRVSDDGGSFLVATGAIVAVAGHAARRVAGVRMGLVGVAEAGRGGVALELTVAAEYGQDLHALADRLRARVAAEVSALTGLEPVEIRVTIDDVFPALRAREQVRGP